MKKSAFGTSTAFWMLLSVGLWFEASPCQALFERKSAFPGAAGGGAASVFANPAGLRFSKVSEWTSFYSQLPSVEGMSQYGSAVSWQAPLAAVGAGYSQFGLPQYRESEAAASASAALSSKVFVGAGAKGYSLSIDGFGAARAFGLDAGVLAAVHPELALGAYGKNLNRPRMGASRIPLPTGMVAGMAAGPFEGFSLFLDLEAIEPDPVSFRAVLEFGLARRLFLRGGLQNNSLRFQGGFGLSAKGFRFDYFYLHHAVLGGSHQAALSIRWGSLAIEPD